MKKKKDHKEGLDPVDCKMIHLLQKDGRMSNTAMAQVLGISEFTVRKRLKRILDSGIIRIVAVGSPLDLGFEISGNLKIRIDLNKTEQVVDRLREIDEVIWVALTTGGTDIDVDFAVRSMKELQDLIFNKISHIDGVLSTETSLMVELVKEKSDIGTAWD
ncbi:MAG: Lrp/AsnC family transcriptional regulator [Deltaproteobacteria bacterium]|nr:Lrp/AsnC family transcriptional regulator [Deltaproteobacteria bacterium]